MKAWLRSWPALGWAWMLASIACIHAFGISLAPVADDGYFAQMLSRYTLAQYLDHRYHTWTGRLPIEAVLVVIVHHPWLWRACNSAMLVLLCVASGRLARVGTDLSRSGAAVLAFMLVMLMTPQAIFESAWWLTGSLNYLWPIALGLWSLVPLVEGGAYRWPQRLGFVLAAAWAAYCDQLALVLVPLSLGLLAWRGWQRRATAWDVVQAVVLCANAAVALGAPGNARRFLEEQGMRFPNFADQDVLEKLRIGLGLIARALATRAPTWSAWSPRWPCCCCGPARCRGWSRPCWGWCWRRCWCSWCCSCLACPAIRCSCGCPGAWTVMRSLSAGITCCRRGWPSAPVAW